MTFKNGYCFLHKKMKIISFIISNSHAKHTKSDIFLQIKKKKLPSDYSEIIFFQKITMALVFKIKSSVWHQFVKEELNFCCWKTRIFCCRKNLFKTIVQLKSETAGRAEWRNPARDGVGKTGPLARIWFRALKFAKLTFS